MALGRHLRSRHLRRRHFGIFCYDEADAAFLHEDKDSFFYTFVTHDVVVKFTRQLSTSCIS